MTWALARVGGRVLATFTLALLGAVAAVLALTAPTTATNDYSVSAVISWAVFCLGAASGSYLALTKRTWRQRLLVWIAATLAFGVVLFFTTDWVSRYNRPVDQCQYHAPAWFLKLSDRPGGASRPLRPYIGRFEGTAQIQRLPPGVHCERAGRSVLLAPSAKAWFVLAGYASCGGFVLAAPLLWLLGLFGRSNRPASLARMA